MTHPVLTDVSQQARWGDDTDPVAGLPDPPAPVAAAPATAPATSGPPQFLGDSPIAVVIVDDHEIVRRGLKDLLESDSRITVVGEAGDAGQAVRRIPALRPRVVVLDVQLPDGSGIEVCRAVKQALPDTAVLILTSFDDDDALMAAILAGASGYLLKQIRGNDLVDAVVRVAAGQSLLSPEVTEKVLRRLREPPATDAGLAGLTRTERRVVGLIADGLTNRQIAGACGTTEKTVKNHVSSMLAKLGLTSRTQAALYLRDHGAVGSQGHAER